MEKEKYQRAENHWKRHDIVASRMPEGAVRKTADAFIATHATCALATACSDRVRCTPLEYNWLDGRIYIFSEGGEKFHALSENKNVCLAIFEPSSDFGDLSSIQITGTAEILEIGCARYSKVLEYKGYSENAIRKMPTPLYLIEITPLKMELLFSKFKDQGYDSRQRIIWQ